MLIFYVSFVFFFQAEDGIRDIGVTGVQTCALPICAAPLGRRSRRAPRTPRTTPSAAGSPRGRQDPGRPRDGSRTPTRSEEHTSELQSRQYLVCRLLLEEKKRKNGVYRGTSKRPGGR